MRRWTLTLFLLGAAAAAAVIAPRLQGWTAPPRVTEPAAIPEVLAPPTLVVAPPVAGIPELSDPPPPAPPAQEFWDDCPVCGMG